MLAKVYLSVLDSNYVVVRSGLFDIGQFNSLELNPEACNWLIITNKFVKAHHSGCCDLLNGLLVSI